MLRIAIGGQAKTAVMHLYEPQILLYKKCLFLFCLKNPYCFDWNICLCAWEINPFVPCLTTMTVSLFALQQIAVYTILLLALRLLS